MSDTRGFFDRTFDGVLISRSARYHNTISCPIDKTSRVTHNTYSLRVMEVALITPPTTFKVLVLTSNYEYVSRAFVNTSSV